MNFPSFFCDLFHFLRTSVSVSQCDQSQEKKENEFNRLTPDAKAFFSDYFPGNDIFLHTAAMIRL